MGTAGVGPPVRSAIIQLMEECAMGRRSLSGVSKFEVELKTVDIILIVFLASMTTLEILFRTNVSGWGLLVIENVAIGFTVIMMSSIIRKVHSPVLRSTGNIVLYLGTLSAVYNEMGRIIHLIFPHFHDASINNMETALFGIQPTVWMQRFTSPSITEFMMFAYVVYALLLPVVAVILLRRGTEREIERYLTELVFTNLVCYTFYFMIPVAGPSRALVAERIVPVQGYFFTAISEYMVRSVHLNGGAFPSAHCAATVVMFAALYRHGRHWGIAFLPMALLIFISTVYGWFHYVSDVVCGIGLAALCLRIAPALQRSLSRWYLRINLVTGRTVSPEVVHDKQVLEETV